MDTSKLKPFAQEARRTLKAQVSARLDLVLADQSAARREQPKAVAELEAQIAKTDRDQVVERVAYTWFNRFTALRFMDSNGYTRLKVVSPADGQTRPEILAEAAAGNIDDEAPADVRLKVAALLDGRTPSADGQGEAYRLLLVAACNQWHATMPFMFEKIADYTELLLPEDLLSSDSLLSKARAVMTDEACRDVEIIGWLYQFYISEKKDEVFAGLKKNKKITPENIPAATQLFTPHWIVRYLVENSLGRLWLLNRPKSQLATRMDYYIAPEEPEADFLRISKPEEIRICDPACGSGHMLTYAFDLLYEIYEEEGYEATGIPGLILTHNLHGIEIDDRAGALAAFALSMKAAMKLGRRRLLKLEAKPNICVLQNLQFTGAEMQDVLAVVGSDLFTNDFRETMGQFEQAKNFGSLIVPKLHDPAEVARVVRMKDFSHDLLLREVQARMLQMLEMAEALTPKYHVVVANPPYAGAKGLNEVASAWLKKNYPIAKSDLYAAFIQRAESLSHNCAHVGMVTMESWMFLSSFEGLRASFFESFTVCSMVHMPYLGKGGTSMGINFGTSAFVSQKISMPNFKGHFSCVRYYETDEDGVPHHFPTINERTRRTSTNDFFKVPGKPIAYWVSDAVFDTFSEFDPLESSVLLRQGMSTTDADRFERRWHEISNAVFDRRRTEPFQDKDLSGHWFPFNKGGEFRKWYGNLSSVVRYEKNGFDLIELVKNKYPNISDPEFVIKNRSYFFRPFITYTSLSSKAFSAKFVPSGFAFSVAGPAIFPESVSKEALLCFLCSKPMITFWHTINPTLGFQISDLERVPFDSGVYTKKEIEIQRVYNGVLSIAKSDWDAFETSWDFNSLPLLSPDFRSETLAQTYTAIRAHWQSVTDEMKLLEEENNSIFIDVYGLRDELTPEVPVEEITVSCNPAYRYGIKSKPNELEARLLGDTMAEFLHYAVGCMFGRYSLDAPGLILASQGEGLSEYLARVPAPTFEPDADNVIPVLDRDWFADDITERFRKFLRVTFGEDRFAENLAFIEEALGKDVRKYFTRDFFNDHVKRYKKRPIYWMFSSPKGSFQALIYMHRYQPDTVSVVLNDYLREFRNKLEAHRKSLEAIAISPDATPTQRTKAEKEIGDVTKVIAELDEYERDILYPLATQKVEIDLDDGVKANYPKFGAALKPIKGLSDADD